MNKDQIIRIAEDALKGAALTAAVSSVNQLTKGVTIGGRKIVLFTARK